MSLPPAAILTALGQAQLGIVAPALEGSYAGGTAATIGLALLLLAQDAAGAPARDARTAERAAALLAEGGASVPETLAAQLEALDSLLAAAAPDLERRILDLYVEMSEAAFVAPPTMPTQE
jgi:hypothetical protein